MCCLCWPNVQAAELPLNWLLPSWSKRQARLKAAFGLSSRSIGLSRSGGHDNRAQTAAPRSVRLASASCCIARGFCKRFWESLACWASCACTTLHNHALALQYLLSEQTSDRYIKWLLLQQQSCACNASCCVTPGMSPCTWINCIKCLWLTQPMRCFLMQLLPRTSL